MKTTRVLAALVVAVVCCSLVSGTRDARSAESGEQATGVGGFGGGRPGGAGQRPLTTQQFEKRLEFFERRYTRRLLPALSRSLQFTEAQFKLLEDGFLFALQTAVNAANLPTTLPPGFGNTVNGPLNGPLNNFNLGG